MLPLFRECSKAVQGAIFDDLLRAAQLRDRWARVWACCCCCCCCCCRASAIVSAAAAAPPPHTHTHTWSLLYAAIRVLLDTARAAGQRCSRRSRHCWSQRSACCPSTSGRRWPRQRRRRLWRQAGRRGGRQVGLRASLGWRVAGVAAAVAAAEGRCGGARGRPHCWRLHITHGAACCTPEGALDEPCSDDGEDADAPAAPAVLGDVPNDVVVRILQSLDPCTLAAAACVCR
jgi:hypothetical protein